MSGAVTKQPFSTLELSVRLACAFVLFASSAGAAENLKLPTPTSDERMEYIRRARVWEPSDVSSKDLYNGPTGELKLGVDQEVACDFVPKALFGWTEKFLCRLEDGRVFKVKYNEGDRYKEAFGEVLGTRLFWALGFYADRMLPVRVTCHGCPKRPWRYVNARTNKRRLDADGLVRSLPPEAEVGTYTFDPAAIEEELDVEKIEEQKKQGWSWKSMSWVDEGHGGATRAEIDALKLLSAFVQNADNAAEQNTLACPRDAIVKDDTGKVICRRPIMYVDDLGSVFGKGGLTTRYSGRVDYQGWKRRPVWRDRETCKARLAPIGSIFQTSTLRDPVISEAGRALLATQLEQLSDAQIADLFRAARIERLHQTISDGSGRRQVTVKDWVELFKMKRDEITNHSGCRTQ
ncbi:MAG TPA: hypothetical protein VFG76_01405 [Candidatus Polarisedimenticolia bacterium]|nr:hypothetical protein [Candidatus Polarisedimenticolia bacterium]